MRVLTSRWTYAALGVFEAGDAVASAIPIRYVAATMDRLGIPPRLRWLVPTAKAATALGLLSVFFAPRLARLARLTTLSLTGYFAGAIVLHVRARNAPAKMVAPAALLLVFAAMTVRGPDTGSRPVPPVRS